MKQPEAFSLAIGSLSGEQLCSQRRRAVFRWIRAGGVVVAHDAEEPAAFGLSDTVLEGESLQITTNLRAVGSACRRLNDDVVYLWNCPLQAEYQVCIGHGPMGVARDGLISRIGPACFAGGQPQAQLEVYRVGSEEFAGEYASARLVLPRGLCAFIYQRKAGTLECAPRAKLGQDTLSDAEVMDAMLEVSA